MKSPCKQRVSVYTQAKMKTEDILAFAAIAGARAESYEKHFPAYPDNWPSLDTPCPPWPEPLQVTPTTARWNAAEATQNKDYRESYWRWLLKACVPAPNEELIQRYGPDATIAVAQMGKWAYGCRGAPTATYYFKRFGHLSGRMSLRTLDIHTLPPIGPACSSLELDNLPNLKRFTDKSFSQLSALTIRHCPALEETPELPQLETPGVRFAIEIEKGVFDLANELKCETEHPCYTLQVPALIEHLRVWRRRVFWRKNLEELWAEAGKPSRVSARLERLGFEGFEEQICEGIARGPEKTWATCKKPERNWLDLVYAGPGICSYRDRRKDVVTIDHHGPVYHVKCRFCGDPWFARTPLGYDPLCH
jgi:hypothetical protein